MEETTISTSIEAGWEIKDRNYYLLRDMAPLTYTLPSKHTRRLVFAILQKTLCSPFWLRENLKMP